MAIDATVVPIFQYTAGIAVVRRKTGDDITKQWWSAHLAAIELPNGVSRTLVRVSHDNGGWQMTQARVVVWEECESLMQQLAAIDDEARELLITDAKEGLAATGIGCKSMKDAWRELGWYDLPKLTTRYITLRFLWASVQVGLFPQWTSIFPTEPDARPSIRGLLRGMDTRPKEETKYKPTLLWERAREVLGEAGITRAEEIRRDGKW